MAVYCKSGGPYICRNRLNKSGGGLGGGVGVLIRIQIKISLGSTVAHSGFQSSIQASQFQVG